MLVHTGTNSQLTKEIKMTQPTHTPYAFKYNGFFHFPLGMEFEIEGEKSYRCEVCEKDEDEKFKTVGHTIFDTKTILSAEAL